MLKKLIPLRGAAALVLLAAAGLVQAAPALAESDLKHVVILQSYHWGYPFTDGVLSGMKEVFDHAPFEVEPHLEYMDAKRMRHPGYDAELVQLYRRKYAGKRFDLVMVSDNDALDLLRLHRAELFGETPVVFDGINDFDRGMVAGQGGMTGVVENTDYLANMLLAQELFPDLEELVVISDRTTTGAAHEHGARKAAERFRGKAAVTFWSFSDFTLPEVTQRAAQLKPHSAILLLHHFLDRRGELHTSRQAIGALTAASKVPIFVVTDGRIGGGPLGGYVVSGYHQGRLAAEIGLRILSGEPAESIPMVTHSPNRYIFDYRALKRFGIPEYKLPPGSEIWFRPSREALIRRLLLWAAFAIAGLGSMVCILMINIARRKRAEEELRISEEKHRQLVETCNEGIIAINEHATVTYVNRRMGEMLGFPPDEMLGRPVESFMPVSELADHRRRWQEREKLAMGDYERSYLHKNGRVISFNVSAMPLVDRDRRFKGSLAMLSDITTRRQAEEALAAEKERLAITLASISEGVMAADMAGRVVLMNQAAKEITGWQQAECAGRQLDELLLLRHERTGEPCHNVGEALMAASEGVGQRRWLLRGHDGKERVVRCSGAAMRDPAGRSAGIVVVFHDVTAASRLEAELQRAAKLESVGVLAGGIAHDFNNLLCAIAGNAGLALCALGSEDGEARQYLENLEAATLRARGLTQQLLTFARGTAPQKKSVPLEPLLREAVQFALAGSHNRAQIECGELYPVHADPNQITQVLHNLLLNADQAMPSAGEIMVRAANREIGPSSGLPLAPGSYVEIAVIDQGIGIPADILPRIFDPFFTTKSKGSGLGLASVHSIVRAHQGCIRAASAAGRGASFTFYLPADGERKSAVERRAAAAPAVPPRRILVLDDEAAIRCMLQALLAQLGHEAVTAADGRSALAEIEQAQREQRPFDLAILDLTVPGGMGGAELLKELRARGIALCAVASSGYATDPVMACYQDYGFAARLPKPYRAADLQELIAALSVAAANPSLSAGRRATATEAG